MGALGKYYGAQRVYTLSLLNSNTTVSGQHEWAAPGKHSILRQLAGTSIEKMPMLKRALIAARPIVMNNQGVYQREEQQKDDENPWCFIIIPIIIDSKTQGFLCIENPSEHRMDVALPYAVIPILLHERARFGLNAAGMVIAGRDELTGLPDHSAYNSAVLAFNPDAYHSIGAICISAVAMHDVNRSKGVEYGDVMLVFASQTIADICKKAQIFRLSGTEFGVIITNLSKEAFQSQCGRIQSVLQRRYPKRFGFGSAWSDKPVSVRKLMLEAEALANNGLPSAPAPVAQRRRSDEGIDDIKEALEGRRFYMLLQPQVDMRTGKAIGAEALARCSDKQGRLILPSEFIYTLEAEGVIRELDFYVLDLALYTLQSWINDGVTPVPISVYFSRQTLLSPTVIASVMAIRSRYEVPDQFIEIEVTESIGDSAPDAMRNAIEGIRAQGFKFALDDLGSEYSSLKTLGDHSFDTIKMDKSLIDGFLFNTMSRSVVESIVGICAKNGVRCLAEGVQTEKHVAALLDAGCVYAQGYYYGKPMPVDDFCNKFLTRGN